MAEQSWVPVTLALPPEGLVIEVHIPKWPGKGYDAADATYLNGVWHRVVGLTLALPNLQPTPAPMRWRHSASQWNVPPSGRPDPDV
jgi:hypothetical protein